MIYAAAHGNARSLTHWVRPGIKPASSWILVGLATTEPQCELPCLLFLMLVVGLGFCYRHLLGGSRHSPGDMVLVSGKERDFSLSTQPSSHPEDTLLSLLTLCPHILSFFFFFLMAFPLAFGSFLAGQGRNLGCGCNLHHRCGNARSLTHCAGPCFHSDLSHCSQNLNLLCHSRNSQVFCLMPRLRLLKLKSQIWLLFSVSCWMVFYQGTKAEFCSAVLK